MPRVKPMLDDIELEKVQKIEIDGDQVLVEHEIPALEGDFFQGIGRRANSVSLSGVMTGSESGENLKTLRDKFRNTEPISFVSDIATSTRLEQVLIEEMRVRELAGKPERFEYALKLREFIEPPEIISEVPPEPEIPTPEIPDDDIDEEVGTLVVEVIVEGRPDFDFSKVTVSVNSTDEDGNPFTRDLKNRNENIWTEDKLPANEYTVEAIAADPEPMSGSKSATVSAGQKEEVQITLTPGVTVAKAFVIHFHFDNSFIEPCMRPVMRQVEEHAKSNKNDKLLIVGHTDKTGIERYNQSLSERRARSAYAYLTVGGAEKEALAEWNELRKRRVGLLPSINDNWDVREYQYILQDLDYYPGEVDGKHRSLTSSAVEAFRCDCGLPPGQTVDDATWEKLIEKYLKQDSLNVEASRFFPNAKDDCSDGIVKWLGCGEEDPLSEPQPPTQQPHRQYRRTEFLFVRAKNIPCDNIPKPDTFNLPEPGVVANQWCLGSGTSGVHCCFLTRDDNHKGKLWLVKPIAPNKIDVNGTIAFEGFEPNKKIKFRLNITAPDGEYVDGENAGGPRRGLSKGKIFEDQTDDNGNASFQFAYTSKPVGVYTLEIEGLSSSQIKGPFVIHLSDESFTKAKGNSVCKLLRSSNDSLDVAAPNVPALREIRLPVVAHLMTARVDTFLGLIMIFPLHRTSRTEADVKSLFEKVNEIWLQARIEFEAKDIVELSYEPPPPVQQEVSEAEFLFLMSQCAYPNVINVFFVKKLAGQSASFAVSRDGGAAEGGCILSDFGNEQTSVELLANALGRVLNLSVLTDPATSDRLMHGGIVRTDTRLIDSEISRARSSKSAQQECFPLTVKVTGATQVGGPESPNFMVVQQSGEVLVEAEVPPKQLALGTLTVQGGNVDPANPHISRIDRNILGRTEVTATFTMSVPTSTGAPPQVYTHKVRIFVVEFDLEVEGQGCLEPGTNEFITQQHPTEQVTIVAKISQLPSCVPDDLIHWEGGQPDPDDPKFPLQIRVSKPNVGNLTVSATLAGTKRSVIIRVIQIEMITQATANAPAATFTRIGLWDNAFRANGTVFNDAAEANNFVGADTRRFHIRVRDAGSRGSGHINVDWRTVDQHDNDIDAPATRNITLVESAANPGTFISRALMLVTDTADQNQSTHHGLPAGIPSGLPAGVTRAGRGQSNHRTRLSSMLGSNIAEYTCATIPVKLPVFQRNPEERRRLPLQIFVLRVAAGGAGVVPTAPGSQIWTRDLRVAEETYARLGIVVETVVAAATPAGNIQQERPFIQNENVHTSGPHAFALLRTPVIIDARNKVEVRPAGGGVQNKTIIYDNNPAAPGTGQVKINRATGRLTFDPGEQPGIRDRIVASYVVVGHQVVLINAPAGVNPLAVAFNPTNDEATLGTNFPALPNTIRVFYTGGLTSGNRGESWPDANFAGQSQVGASFINGARNINGSTHGPYTFAHEIGHVLTNKNANTNTGHYVRPAAPAGNRLHTNQNLMRNGTSRVEGINQSKRLWNNPDADGINQLTAISGSRFIRLF